MKVEFRDGEKEVPDYLADMMSGIDTYKLTLDESIQEANKRMLQRHVSDGLQRVVDEHLSNLEIGR